MEGIPQRKELFTETWFRERALHGLKKLENGKWDYSDSLLLYLPSGDEVYESIQNTETPYHKLVTAPERAYLASIAGQIVERLPKHFEYVDLGPGTEHKEQFIFDAARAQEKTFVYRPVDINERYLQFSAEHALKQGVESHPLQSSFEELYKKAGRGNDQRFVSLGLTYSNYEPAEILSLLKNLTADGGSAYIEAQIRERTRMPELKQIYTEAAHAMVVDKMRLLGVNPETDIKAEETTDEIKVWYTLKNVPPLLSGKGIKAGDKLLVFQSLRPSKETFEQSIAQAFSEYKLFDTNESFIGALLTGGNKKSIP